MGDGSTANPGIVAGVPRIGTKMMPAMHNAIVINNPAITSHGFMFFPQSAK
ncbi:MAG: hypothetical protein ACM3UL_05455 [Ignavibacteria bacterium]